MKISLRGARTARRSRTASRQKNSGAAPKGRTLHKARYRPLAFRLKIPQWVLSVPFALRYRMAYDSQLMRAILNVFVRAGLGHLRRRDRDSLGLIKSQGGAVTFVQRFGDALNLNVHFHMLALDSVYARKGDAPPDFHGLLAPEDDEVTLLAMLAARRVRLFLKCRGVETDDSEDNLSRDDPGLAAMYASSVRSRIAVGSNTGQRVAKLGDQIDGDTLDVLKSPRCATVDGFSVHANVNIDPET